MRVDRRREVERRIKAVGEWGGRKRKPSEGLMGEDRGCRKKETLIGTEKGREEQTETDMHKEILSYSFYLQMKLNVIMIILHLD